jgi:hypothetical protein
MAGSFVRLLTVRRNRLTPSYILAEWLARMSVADEILDRRLVDAATDVVDTMCERPEGARGAFYRFGHTLGADGWQIVEVSQWLGILSTLVDRRSRQRLALFSTNATVAQGWADGFVRGAHTGMCIDPTTGLVTAMVLRLRLKEVYELSDVTAIRAPDMYSLILVDFATDDLPRLEADLLTACVADSVLDVFRQGETIARIGNRVVVLAINSEATLQCADILADRLRFSSSTASAHATVVVDSLPAHPDLLDRFFNDLVS